MSESNSIKIIREFLEENERKKLEVQKLLGDNKDVRINVICNGESYAVDLQLLIEKIIDNKLEEKRQQAQLDFRWNLQLFGEAAYSAFDFEEYSISNNIKEYMNKGKITQEELAEMMGVSRSTVVSMLNNKGISLENAFRLAMLLGVNISDLFKYNKESNV